MTGLDKIIDRILCDAKEKARGILEGARSECSKIAQDYATRADEIRERLTSEADAKGEAIIARARSTVATNRRSLLLQTKSALVDEAFEAAKRALVDTDLGKYRELLIALLTSALIEEAENAEKTLVYGDEITEFDTYDVQMNESDRAAYGHDVLEAARRAVLRRIGEARAAKVRLSEKTVPIDGGLILCYGSIEVNCSLSMLMAQMRKSLEAKVSAILFASEDAASEED